MTTEDGGVSSRPSSALEVNPPSVENWTDFTTLSEISTQDENGEYKFKSSKFLLVDENSYAAWIGTLDIPREKVDVQQAFRSLRRIPDDAIHPPTVPDIPSIKTHEYKPSEDIWLKISNIGVYSWVVGTTIIADELMKEIKTYQCIRQNPHPNLAEFKGCLEKDGRIVGILLKRYGLSLRARVNNTGNRLAQLDSASCMQDIEAAVKHLHSLKLSHNDLNPNNILMSAEDRPVVIDMGSCKKLGDRLQQRGTPGWNDGFKGVSSIANDEIGLEKLKEWLEAKTATTS